MLDDLRVALTGPVGRWRAARLARGFPAGIVLLVLCCSVYLPGTFRVPPIDRDEARFAQASRQMFESVALPAALQDPALHDGGLLIPKVQSKPRLNKPPLIYWAQSASAFFFTAGNPENDAIWMYRIPSALFATIAVFATWRLGCRAFDPRVGFAGAALLAVSPMLVWDAHQARADQLLLACTTATMWMLYETLARAQKPTRPRLYPILFWIALALGILAKGPITPMIAALAVLAYCFKSRNFRQLRALMPVSGLIITAVILAPWIIGVVRTIGFDTYWDIVFGETIGRSGSAKEGHSGPPGYHLILLVPLFWPGVLLTAISIIRAIKRAQGGAAFLTIDEQTERITPPLRVRTMAALRSIFAPAQGRRAELFLLAWIIPSWIVFELIATKLPHYTLPLYPPIALLTARGLLQAASRALDGVDSFSAMLGHKIWLGIGAILCAGLPLTIAIPFGSWPTKAAGALTAILSLVLLWRAWRRLTMLQFGGAQFLSVAAIIVTFAGTLGVLMPAADGLWISPKLIDIIRAHDDGQTRPIAAVGYHEDSLVFLTRGRLQKIDDAHAWVRKNPRGLLIAEPGELDTTKIQSPTLTEVGRVRGYNYSRGRLTDLIIYRAGP